MALNSKQLKAVQLLVYTDKTQGDIAAEIGVKPPTISLWWREDEFIAAVQEEMRRSFSHLATKAVKKMERLLDSNQDSVAFAAAKELLNKAGYQEPQKIEQEIKTQVITVEITDEW